MDARRVGTALLVAAASALCVACEGNAKTCNAFFDVAAPLMSSASIAQGAPSGSAAITWSLDEARRYEQFARETEKLAEQVTDPGMQTALHDAQTAATEVSRGLDQLAKAATDADPTEVGKAKSALVSAARREQVAVGVIERRCTK